MPAHRDGGDFGAGQTVASCLCLCCNSVSGARHAAQLPRYPRVFSLSFFFKTRDFDHRQLYAGPLHLSLGKLGRETAPGPRGSGLGSPGHSPGMWTQGFSRGPAQSVSSSVVKGSLSSEAADAQRGQCESVSVVHWAGGRARVKPWALLCPFQTRRPTARRVPHSILTFVSFRPSSALALTAGSQSLVPTGAPPLGYKVTCPHRCSSPGLQGALPSQGLHPGLQGDKATCPHSCSTHGHKDTYTAEHLL